MAYSNSQQVFMDVLGRIPGEADWKEIDSLLGTLQRAGFEVDDPTNAPHVTLFAWGWARSTPRADVLAAVKAAVMESGKADAPPVDLGPVLQELRELRVAAARPVAVKVDDSVVKDAVTQALREPISMASLSILILAVVLSLYMGVLWGKSQLEPTVQMQQQMIQKLTATHETGRPK